jgi:hypothetical protein
MNPFAKPEEALAYEYEEFPKQESASFDQEFAAENASNGFVDFLHFNASASQSDTPVVQLAVFQDFKEVLSPSLG